MGISLSRKENGITKFVNGGSRPWKSRDHKAILRTSRFWERKYRSMRRVGVESRDILDREGVLVTVTVRECYERWRSEYQTYLDERSIRLICDN